METKIWLLTVLLILLGTSAVPAVEWTITGLGTLGGSSSYAYGMNDNGQVVGVSRNASGEWHAFLWDDTDGMIDLGTLGGDTSDAYGINDAGQVVGYSGAHAFLWDRYNGMTDLGTLGGVRSEAYAINDNGHVVGTSYPASGDWHAFIWDDINGMSDLGTLSGFQSLAYAINNNEEVAGFSDGRAFLWDRYNGMTNLGTLGGYSSGAYGINESGQVVGWASDTYTEHTYHAFLWDANGGMTDLGTLGGDYSEAYGINDSGQVVGWSKVIYTAHMGHAFIWDSNSGMVDLNNLLPPNSGWSHLEEAYSINNHGQIVGSGINDRGQTHAFLMSPIVLKAEINIKPKSLNLRSKGKWINCEIRFGEDCNAADVNSASVILEDEIPAEWIWFNEEQNAVMAKFARSEVAEILEPGEVELTVTGELLDGTYFEGVDTIKVVDRSGAGAEVRSRKRERGKRRRR